MDEYINIGRWFSILHRRSQIFVVEASARLNLTYSENVMLLRIFDHEARARMNWQRCCISTRLS